MRREGADGSWDTDVDDDGLPRTAPGQVAIQGSASRTGATRLTLAAAIGRPDLQMFPRDHRPGWRNWHTQGT